MSGTYYCIWPTRGPSRELLNMHQFPFGDIDVRYQLFTLCPPAILKVFMGINSCADCIIYLNLGIWSRDWGSWCWAMICRREVLPSREEKMQGEVRWLLSFWFASDADCRSRVYQICRGAGGRWAELVISIVSRPRWDISRYILLFSSLHLEYQGSRTAIF